MDIEKRLRSPVSRISSGISSQLISAYLCLSKKTLLPYNEIPVVINNFNRLEWLRAQLAWLERAGMKNVSIIDNGSTYPPLLTYYDFSCKYKVYRERNLGPLALWGCYELWRNIRNTYYIYTDPDVLPVEDCPLDCAAFLRNQLECHPLLNKIGLGLKIDDLPDCYIKKPDVINWESQYWKIRISPQLYRAAVDTTFALYRPRVMGGWWLRGARTDGPYLARHLPWYQNSLALDEEESYYVKVARRGISTWTEATGHL